MTKGQQNLSRIAVGLSLECAPVPLRVAAEFGEKYDEGGDGKAHGEQPSRGHGGALVRFRDGSISTIEANLRRVPVDCRQVVSTAVLG